MDIFERRRIFLSNIRDFDDDLLKVKNIQNKYRAGEIKEEDLSLKQKESLYKLYDMQITNLKKSNDMKKSALFNNISNIIKNSLEKNNKTKFEEGVNKQNINNFVGLKNEKSNQDEEMFKNRISNNSSGNELFILEYKLENGKIKISDLSNNELDKMIEHYKRKNKIKENILKMKRKKLNDRK